MSRVLHLARREWLEQARQPAMIASIVTLFVAIAGLVAGSLLLLDHVAADPDLVSAVAAWFPQTDDGPALVASMAGSAVGVGNWLLFTQYLGITGVLAGHAVLHDRQCGTLPFLLLAPVTRTELLVGKVLGVLGPSTVVWLALSTAVGAVAAALPVTAPYADRLPTSPQWWIAFVAGGPAWAAFVGALCAIGSSLARDVRTAQQSVWLLMFFATFGCGFLLAGLMPSGPLVAGAVAGLGLLGTAGAVLVGGRVISRDLGR